MSFQQEIRPQAKPQAPSAHSTSTLSTAPHAGSSPASFSAHGDPPNRTNNPPSSGGVTGPQKASVAARSTSPAQNQPKPGSARGLLTAAGATTPAGGGPTPDCTDEENKKLARNKSQNQKDYKSKFPSVAFSGINSDQDDAEGHSRKVNGDRTPHGYSAYGLAPNDYHQELGRCSALDSPASSGFFDLLDMRGYVESSKEQVRLNGIDKNTGKPKVEWHDLSERNAQLVNNGYKTVMAEIASRPGGDIQDKDQFISLLGSSGGGQAGFFTAMKLADEGYKNLSLVGVDMVLDPSERQKLELLGINVTNITSHSTDLSNPGQSRNSELGEGVRGLMKGEQDYYDLNVQRQKPTDKDGRHQMANDANVVTAVRFAQYLDSIGQHGNYTPDLYDKFTSENVKANQFDGVPADSDLLNKLGPNLGAAASLQSPGLASPHAMYAD